MEKYWKIFRKFLYYFLILIFIFPVNAELQTITINGSSVSGELGAATTICNETNEEDCDPDHFDSGYSAHIGRHNYAGTENPSAVYVIEIPQGQFCVDRLSLRLNYQVNDVYHRSGSYSDHDVFVKLKNFADNEFHLLDSTVNLATSKSGGDYEYEGTLDFGSETSPNEWGHEKTFTTDITRTFAPLSIDGTESEGLYLSESLGQSKVEIQISTNPGSSGGDRHTRVEVDWIQLRYYIENTPPSNPNVAKMEQKLEPNSTVTIDFEYGGYDGCGLSHIEYNWVDSYGVLFFPKNDRYEPIEDYFVSQISGIQTPEREGQYRFMWRAVDINGNYAELAYSDWTTIEYAEERKLPLSEFGFILIIGIVGVSSLLIIRLKASSNSLSNNHAKAFTNKKKAKPKPMPVSPPPKVRPIPPRRPPTVKPGPPKIFIKGSTAKSSPRVKTVINRSPAQKVTGGLENFHTVKEMKSALRKIGSPTSGNKSELAERLYKILKELQNKLMQNYDPRRYRMYAEAYSDLASGIPPEPERLAKLYIDDSTQDYSQLQTSNSDPNSEAYLENETAREQFENNTWKNNMDTEIVHETKFNEIRKTTLKLQNEFGLQGRALIIKTPKNGYEKMLEREINTTRTITKNKITTKVSKDSTDNIVGPTIFFSRAEKSPILVLEEIGDKDISSIEKFSNREKMECLTKVAEDIFSLHKIGWVHRDIKPKNIMISESPSNPVLIDYGSALRINKKQGGIVGGQTKTEFYGHITQEKAEERAHPGQDWFGFSRTCLELILVENSQTLTSMIMGGSIENKISQFFKKYNNLENSLESPFDGDSTQTRMEALEELLIYSTTMEAESAAGLERLLIIGQKILE